MINDSPADFLFANVGADATGCAVFRQQETVAEVITRALTDKYRELYGTVAVTLDFLDSVVDEGYEVPFKPDAWAEAVDAVMSEVERAIEAERQRQQD